MDQAKIIDTFGTYHLAVYKGSNHKGEIIIVWLKGNKAVNKSSVNYDGNMDWGAVTFTSDVSLPKDGKQLCWVKKLQLGN